MYDPLHGTFHPVLSHREVFQPEDAPLLLFGADDTERVVAIEPFGDNEVLLYRRTSNGRTETERRVFDPWMIVRDPSPFLNRNDADVTHLRGELPFGHLVTLASYPGWRSVTDQLPDSAWIGPNSLTGQYQVRSGLTQFKGMEYPDLKRMQLDIETLSLDPNDPDAAVIMIAIRQGTFEDVLVLESTEADLFERFTKLVRELDPDVMEGHNIYRFDLPYLLDRSRRAGIPLQLGRDRSMPRLLESNRRHPTVFIHGRHVIDTYTQIQRFDVAGNLPRYGLKDAIRTLGLEREDRVFVEGDQIARMWRSGERDKDVLQAYALDDVRDVDVLSRVIMPTEFYQTQMLPMSYQRSSSTGSGRKIDELMLRSYVAAGHSLPTPEPARPYPGGYVELVQSGVFEPVVKCDVESLYPSIMIRESIRSQRDTLETFPLLLRDLTRRRIDAKRRAATTVGEDKARWSAIQGSFKILINSFYGYLGFGVGAFNDYAAAERVTLEGQRIILDVVRLLKAYDCDVIEIDTDGVYFSPPEQDTTLDDEQALIAAIGKQLPEGINLAHDGRFRSMLSLQQKTYALLDYDDELRLTGSALRSRALEPFLQEFIRNAARAMMERGLEGFREEYFTLAEQVRDHRLSIHQMSQWTMVRRDTLGGRTRLRKLLESHPNRWRFGERVEIYERDDGTLAFAGDYDADEHTNALLRKLHDVARRFASAVPDAQAFDAAVPRITVSTNLDAAKRQQASSQLSLF